MDLRAGFYCFVVLLAVGLLGYAFSFVGVPGTIVDGPWKLVALAIGAGIVVAFAWPHVRGVRAGDSVAATISRKRAHEGQAFFFTQQVFVRALSSAHKGGRIRIDLGGGKRGEGVVVEYAGLLSPARVNLTEAEN